MADRERVMKELSWLIYNFPQQKDPEDAADKMCNAINTYCSDALALLKEQEKEIKALRKLLDWAMECDFGIDNLGDWWTERFAEEIEGMGYKESLIHLAKRYIEVFEGGEDDA